MNVNQPMVNLTVLTQDVESSCANKVATINATADANVVNQGFNFRDLQIIINNESQQAFALEVANKTKTIKGFKENAAE